MSEAQSVVIPQGFRIQIEEDGIVVVHDGDIVLRSGLGGNLRRVVSQGGSVTLEGNFSAGSVEASNSVELRGDLRVQSVQAVQGVELSGSTQVGVIECGSRLDASGNVQISEARAADVFLTGDTEGDQSLKVEKLFAKGSVSMDGRTEVGDVFGDGNVQVGGDLKANRIVAENVEIQADNLQAAGIQARGGIAVGGVPISVDIMIAPEVKVTPETRGRLHIVECHNTLGPNSLRGCFPLGEFCEFSEISPDEYLEARGLSGLGEAPPTGATPVSSPSSSAAPEAEADPKMEQLLELIDQIDQSYDDDNRPPVTAKIREFIEAGSYDDLQAEINGYWRELLSFHKEKSTEESNFRVPRKVTSAFNQIHSVLTR